MDGRKQILALVLDVSYQFHNCRKFLLKFLRSMISGLCCRGLCNICSSFYLTFILIYKNKLYWKIYCDDHSSLSCFFPFNSSRSWVFYRAYNRVVANNWFDRFIPTFNRGIVNHGINRFSRTPFYPWISYPGNNEFNLL